MRQMKRALSLVLTMVMLLGMVMIPTSAASNFTDAELIENTEAVAITSGIGLFAGTTDGRFAPKATVTRAQMATIIVKMLRGNEFNADAFKGVDKFPDTAGFEGGWAEGYINACVQLGVVAGYGDGTFKPGRELTAAEAITMIINALGIDPGPGEWPINYMAKAEALKLYGDLETKPASDEPLNRDQLAVIVWEGLQYSPEGKSGYKIPGSDLVFTDIADAVLANGNKFEGITEAVGQDSLASKVYEIKTATGWITGNAATGEPCTVLTSASGVETSYAIQTSVDMLGHYVTIYYNEQYKNDEEPGEVYTIVDESTVVTVKEAINSAKEYKAAFGKNINEAQNGLLLNSNYVVTEKLSNNMTNAIPGYTAGSAAAKGSYIIADGVIVAYIEPVAVYASYVLDIGTVEDDECIWINGANSGTPIPNTEGDDQVVEYSGIKTGDYVTYVVVNGVYVLSPVTQVRGAVTKTAATEVNGEEYNTITIDGIAYPAFEAKGTSPSNNYVGQKLNNDLSAVQYGSNYVLHIAANGHYIGFESAGSTVSVANTLFLLGSVTIKEKDQYGKTSFVTKARGVDLGGSEVMLITGKAKDTNGNGVYDPATDETLGDMSMVLQGYYSFAESTDKEEKKEGIYDLTAYPGAYSPETPTYAIKARTTTGTFTGSSGSIATSEGIAAFGQGSIKVLIIDGSVNDSSPLTVTTSLPSGFHIDSSERDYYILVTRAASGAMSYLEAFTYLSTEAHGKDVYFMATKEQIDAPSRTADGIGYTVYDAASGKESEIILDPGANISLTAPGMYRGTADSDGLIMAINPVSPSTTANFTDDDPQVVNNIGFWGLTGNRLRGERLASDTGVKVDMITGWNNNASSARVIDLRTDEEIKASGVARITSLENMTKMRESDPGLMVIYDMYMEDGTGSTPSGVTKTVFITRAIRRTAGMNSIVYAKDDPSTGDNMIFVRGLAGNLGDEVKVDFEAGKNVGPGFYRFSVNADGKLALLPFDTDTVSTGNYGMIAMHDTISKVENIDAGTVLVTTENSAHSCSAKCTDSAVEPLKTFYVTSATKIWDNAAGKWITLDQFKTMQVNYDLNVDYYCDTPVYNSDSASQQGKDDSAELLVITDKKFIATSCDGSHAGTPVASAADITGSGQYYLTADLSSLNITSGTVELCLNGHSINGAVTVSGGELSVINCEGRSGGQITGGLTVNGGKAIVDDAVSVTGVTVATNGSFELVGGAVRGGSDSGVNNAGTFVMSGGIITGNSAATNGGGVYNSGTFTMTGGTITGNTATNGGGLYNSGTFNMNGDSAAIVGNTATVESGRAGGGGVYNAGTFKLIKGSISGNTAVKRMGGGVFNNGGTFTMSGGTISGNSAANSTGGGVQVDVGTFVMESGSITGNTAATYGGGVCVNDGTFRMTGGVIKSNNLINGGTGGVDMAIGYNGSTGNGKLNMSGGTIGADTAGVYLVVNEGALELSGTAVVNGELCTTGTGGPANITMSGGTVNGDVVNGEVPPSSYTNAQGACSTTITGGTVHGNVTDATIGGGTFNGELSNSVITGGIIDGTYNLGSDITITGGTFVGKTAADLSGAAIDESYKLVETAQGVSVQSKWTYVELDSTLSQPCVDDAIHVMEITQGGVLASDRNYFLGADLTSGLTFESSAAPVKVTLCLNGHSITTSGTAAISVGNNVTLHLCNCQSSGNIKGGGAGAALLLNGGAVNMYENVHMNGGTYTGNNGGAVQVISGTFDMYGGTISENTANCLNGGAGVYVTGGSFVMHDGAISKNEDTTTSQGDGGGGVSVNGAGSFTLLNGDITENTTIGKGRGGGVHIKNGGTFIMRGGRISGNTAATDGGGIGSNGGATIVIYGGTISDNKTVAPGNGGGAIAVFGTGDTLAIHGGTITGNSSKNGSSLRNGGAIFAGASVPIEIHGGEIYGNTGASGLRVNGKSAAGKISKITGGTIKETFNVVENGKFQITGGTFSANPGTWVPDTHQVTTEDGMYKVTAK